MPIRHKFENVPPMLAGIVWDPRFQTHNAILDVTPYEPEVIIIGTFNHEWPWNDADFFYGRGMYMWTILANMFVTNANVAIDCRNPPPGNNAPTLPEIFRICEKGKITFADIILGTKPDVPTLIDAAKRRVLVNNNNVYQWTGYKDAQLNTMGVNGWLDDNVNNIIDYIKRTPSIKHIYFTFKSGHWLVAKKNLIAAALPHVLSCSIFTPTGMGFGPNLPAPFNERAWSIAHHWVWNTLPNIVPINNLGYGHLDHAWLLRNGVNPNEF